jgi:DNA-directed RNA polymerase subunit RPC12/RpoP
MGVKMVTIKCSVCGASLENYHGQKEVKCEYCGNVQLVEPDAQQMSPIAKPRGGLILGVVLIMTLGGGFVAFYLQAPASKQSAVVKDSLNGPITQPAQDTTKKSVKKSTEGDPLGK